MLPYKDFTVLCTILSKYSVRGVPLGILDVHTFLFHNSIALIPVQKAELRSPINISISHKFLGSDIHNSLFSMVQEPILWINRSLHYLKGRSHKDDLSEITPYFILSLSSLIPDCDTEWGVCLEDTELSGCGDTPLFQVWNWWICNLC